MKNRKRNLKNVSYEKKFIQATENTPFFDLPESEKECIRTIAFELKCTFQHIRELIRLARDFEMWDVAPLSQTAHDILKNIGFISDLRAKREQFFRILRDIEQRLRTEVKSYEGFHGFVPRVKKPLYTVIESDRKIFGPCPVASPLTVCCNLWNIDAVQSCAYGCSYCTIQTFFGAHVLFDAQFQEKLRTLQIDPDRYYHVTTGQSSDSLVWGDREGILSTLVQFAQRHPNILLEFKTKSKNVDPLLRMDTPPNIVCAWSLNTRTIIENEEIGTASLEERIRSARTVREKGMFVAFHFHPMVYYKGWEDEYHEIVKQLMSAFRPEDVLFVSFGSLTFITPVLREIRKRGGKTKILQMPFARDPHGKWTYPDAVKIEMFRSMYTWFTPWHGRVYFYLCMEKGAIWDAVFGWHYETNEEFERDFGRHVFTKIRARYPEHPYPAMLL